MSLSQHVQTYHKHVMACIPFKASKYLRAPLIATYLKLVPCKSLPPSAAGTLPDRELPLRFLQHNSINYSLEYNFFVD
jgi:hypothetical protein